MLDTLVDFPEWFALPLDDWVSACVAWLQANAQFVFDGILAVLRSILQPLQDFLLWLPWSATTALIGGLAWVLRGWRVAVGVVVALLFVGSLGLWDLAMITLALVLTATVVSVALGVPIGILMASSGLVNATVRPVLDFMQTMPSFVYLVPAVMLMGIGPAPALIAVIVYAIPPVIRLTNLGIRNVPGETVEAGTAFGATPGQLLRKVQLPLGFPTLMAGVNQTIMMGLAMVIIASLIDAGGLGGVVLRGLAQLDVGAAFTGGIAIVALAIVIDRISEGASHVGARRRSRRAQRRKGVQEPSGTGGDPSAAMSEHATDHDTSRPEVMLDGVSKIFGPHPETARRMLGEGASKEEILAKTRSTIAVDDVSVEVYPGETFAIMGLSGSGKSTLVRCLNRLVEPTAGTITVGGENVSAMSREELRDLRRRKLGMVFQRFALLPHRSVLDNVSFGLEVRGNDRDGREKAGRRVLDVVGLTEWAQSFPDELSGGMQQRVGLARALATDPDILLMDEPFSALDPLMRRQLQHELLDLQARLRKTIVFITHDLDEALKLGDRIAIMKDGRFVQVGAPEDILLRPADDYVASFVEGHDKSTMLTARDVMFRTDSRIRSSQRPQVALDRMDREGTSSAYVVDERGRLEGIVTADAAVEGVQRELAEVRACMSPDAATVGPDEPLRNLIPLAVSERYPISVVDDDRRLLGIVARVSILRGLIADEHGQAGAQQTPEPAGAG